LVKDSLRLSGGDPNWPKLEQQFSISAFRIASEIVFYLLQPNDNLARDINTAKNALGWDTLPKPILTLHVRHGKKIHESAYYPNEDFLTVITKMRGKHGFKSLFLVTDDKNASSYFKVHAKSAGFEAIVSLDDPRFVQHGWDKKEPGLRDAALRVEKGSNGCKEAVTTLVNLLIAAETDGFVGLYNSNMGRVIAKLMFARNGKMLPNIALDNFYTKKDKGSCWHDNICTPNKKIILVKTTTDEYPFSVSIE